MTGNAKDCITVASEKADFMADRIAAGVPASEREVRKLARYLREIAARMGPGLKKMRMDLPGAGPDGTLEETAGAS